MRDERYLVRLFAGIESLGWSKKSIFSGYEVSMPYQDLNFPLNISVDGIVFDNSPYGLKRFKDEKLQHDVSMLDGILMFPNPLPKEEEIIEFSGSSELSHRLMGSYIKEFGYYHTMTEADFVDPRTDLCYEVTGKWIQKDPFRPMLLVGDKHGVLFEYFNLPGLSHREEIGMVKGVNSVQDVSITGEFVEKDGLMVMLMHGIKVGEKASRFYREPIRKEI